MENKSIVTGASRGIGAAIAERLAGRRLRGVGLSDLLEPAVLVKE
jgi:NAD(P)-dependent dehydrogenase (short-subunit alcohol dehydrogenase family)